MVQPHRGLLGDGPRCLTAIHARLDRCRLTSKPPVAASAIYPAVYPFPAGWVAGVLALDVLDPYGGRLTVSPVGCIPLGNRGRAGSCLAAWTRHQRKPRLSKRASDHARSERVKMTRDQSQQSQVICVTIETMARGCRLLQSKQQSQRASGLWPKDPTLRIPTTPLQPTRRVPLTKTPTDLDRPFGNLRASRANAISYFL